MATIIATDTNSNNQVPPGPKPLITTGAVVAAALMDVLDAGCDCKSGEKHPWEIDDIHNDDDATKEDMEITILQRLRFRDAVLQRVTELQSRPLNMGLRLENFCDRHRRELLPEPTVNWCPMCPKGE